jgi:DNA repair protein RadC
MSLKHWPEDERPREKLLRLGPAALSEAELLAILLQTGTRGRSAIDTARSMLSEFRSLRGLLTADRAGYRGSGTQNSHSSRPRSSSRGVITPS